jgi:hypothetical protein
MENAEDAMQRRMEYLEEYEEVWKQMREASAREIGRRQRGKDQLEIGDSVFVFVPKLLRTKVDVRWAGPFTLQAKLTATTWQVNGKVEHAFNLKRAVTDDGVASAQDAKEVPLTEAKAAQKRARGEDVSGQVKKQRLRVVLAAIGGLPRGDLLWFE